MERLINPLKLLVNFKDFILGLVWVYLHPGVKLTQDISSLKRVIQKGLFQFIFEHSEFPSQASLNLVKQFNRLGGEKELVEFIEKETEEIEKFLKYGYNKEGVKFKEYFPLIRLSQIDENKASDVNNLLRNVFAGVNPILIIGGCGFIWSHLAKYLIELGACRIDVIDIKQESVLFREKELLSRLKVYPIDITNRVEVTNFFNKNRDYKYIFNFAADKTLPSGNQATYETTNINIMGFINIITVIYELKSKDTNNFNGLIAILHASTDKAFKIQEVFGNTIWANLKEKISIYDASKLTADILALVYCELWKENGVRIPLVVARLCNVFGPYDENDKFRFVPKEIRRMVERKEPPRYWEESADDYREYLYIEDMVRILLQLVNHRAVFRIIDIPGCLYETTREVAEQLVKVYNKHYNPNINGNAMGERHTQGRQAMLQNKKRNSALELLKLDSNIGYFYTFEDGVKETIQYYSSKRD